MDDYWTIERLLNDFSYNIKKVLYNVYKDGDKMQENENIEFKELYTENIYKEIVAFLNSGSGTIYIGYNDNGELIGLENVKETEEKISNGIRGKIVPDCSVFVSINNSTLDNKDYIIINVSKGVNIYSLKELI